MEKHEVAYISNDISMKMLCKRFVQDLSMLW